MNIFSQLNSIKKSLIRVVILLLISASSLIAQNSRIDSLKQKLAGTPDLESFEINFQLAREFTDVDLNTSLEFAMKAKSLAYLKQDSLNIVRSLRILGQVYRRMSNLDLSLYYLQKGLPIARRNNFDEEHAAILNGMGGTYSFLSKYDRALSYFLQSLVLRERSEDKSKISVIQNNIGFIYFKLRDHKMALVHFTKSLDLKISTNDNVDMDILLLNISLCHAYLGNLQEARESLQSVFKKCPEKCDDNLSVMAFHASGVVWFKTASLKYAEKDFLQSYMLATRTSNQRFMFDNITSLSVIYLKQGNFAMAEKFLLEGERITKTSHFDLEEMKLYEQLCSLYMAKENYKKLSFYQEKYIQMKDSVSNDTQTNNLMSLHAQASEEENKTQLASQELSVQLKEVVINKQSLANILIGVAVALLAVLLYLLTKIFLQRKEANYLLNKKVLERSDELSQNQQSLKLAIEQRDVALVKLSQDLTKSIESMRSLCSVGNEMQADSNAQRYFNEINITTRNLSNSLSNILSESKVA